jgi:hypothetical protein
MNVWAMMRGDFEKIPTRAMESQTAQTFETTVPMSEFYTTWV